MTGVRRLSRELALQVLFQQEFTPSGIEAGLAMFKDGFSAEAEVWDYALTLLKGIEAHRQEIDRLIESKSAHWTLKRMALVDLNIMRIAAFETLFAEEKIPPAVAINEAVEISKKFGSVDSAPFVNGVLDQIVK